MKKFLILISFFLYIAGCTDSGGGVTNAPPAPPPIIIPPTPAFNQVLSNLKVQDASEAITTSGQVNQNLSLVLTARDQFGKLMSGLNIKLGLKFVPGLLDIVATENSPGKYTIPIILSYQGDFTAYVKLNDTELNIFYQLNISYCNSPSDGTHPFHSRITNLSKQFYIICTPSQLAIIGSTNTYLADNFALGKDIDLTNYYSYSNNNSVPDNQFKIGSSATPYTGHFFGAGFGIKKFQFKSQTIDDVGLFGTIANGAILDFIIINEATVFGRSNVGVLVGKILASTNPVEINSSFILNDSKVSGSGNKIGGLIGFAHNDGAAITLTKNNVSITQNFNGATSSQSQIGGLIGHNIGAEIREVSVHSLFTYTDKLFSISKVGGFIGEDSSVGGSKISQSTITAIQNYSFGTQIGCLIGYSNNSIIQDIGLGSSCFISQENSSTGDITVSGGMFGEIMNSTINNLNSFINASNISGSFGGLAGLIQASSVTNSSISGTLSGSGSNFGGIAGSAISSSFTKVSSYTNIVLSGGFNSIGGIIGNSQNNLLSKVANYGTIKVVDSSIVGGLIGYAVGSLTIDNSLNNGFIFGDSLVGGLIGQSADSSAKILTNVYNSGNITANSFVGGIIGTTNGAGTSVSHSFNIGAIQTSTNSIPTQSGAFIGENLNSGATFTNNFFLSEASIITNGCGSGVGCASVTSGLYNTNTAEDLNTDLKYYSDKTNPPLDSWDFSTIWDVFHPFPPFPPFLR